MGFLYTVHGRTNIAKQKKKDLTDLKTVIETATKPNLKLLILYYIKKLEMQQTKSKKVYETTKTEDVECFIYKASVDYFF